MPTLPAPCLAVLTDRTLLTPNWTLAQALAPAVTGGANFVIYRETDLPSTPRTTVFRFVQDGVRGRVPVVAQGSAEWAQSVDADGLHLEGVGVSADEARTILGPEKWIGVTVTTTAEAEAVGGSADYVLIYVDWSESGAALDLVRRFVGSSRVPLVVGPDVPLEHAAACISAGAAGIAVTDAAMSAYDKTGALRRYAEALGIISFS